MKYREKEEILGGWGDKIFQPTPLLLWNALARKTKDRFNFQKGLRLEISFDLCVQMPLKKKKIVSNHSGTVFSPNIQTHFSLKIFFLPLRSPVTAIRPEPICQFFPPSCFPIYLIYPGSLWFTLLMSEINLSDLSFISALKTDFTVRSDTRRTLKIHFQILWGGHSERSTQGDLTSTNARARLRRKKRETAR